MKDRLFALFFACTVIGTFTFGFQVGKQLQSLNDGTAANVSRVTKADSLRDRTVVAKNP